MKNVTRKNDDLDRYIEDRIQRDGEFAQAWEDEKEEWELGQVLLREREKAGLTQEALAGRIGTTRSAACRYERHPTNLTVGILSKIADALGKKLVVKLA